MIGIAVNTDALRKRIIRFFDSYARAQILNFVRHLSAIGEVYVFGGLIRDIALFGGKEFNSDIDLVVECSQVDLDYFFSACELLAQRNKFGGYRTILDGWSVDVWAVEETWAFKEGLVEYSGVESLLSTTVTTWESVLFSFRTRKIISSMDYLERISRGELDVVLVENPNRLGVLLKLLKAMCDKRARIVMPGALAYLKVELLEYSSVYLEQAQRNALGRVYLDYSSIDDLKWQVRNMNFDLFGSVVDIKGSNLNIKF
ncbi:hypothetical protein [Pseudomonas sp.]|uniref:hypothetical protein n=1 Tax=Pseudomonas sp. TaxID=306 RepID=UPI00258F4848|nr:hypothetical protein [Pseudomonas sp.]